MPTQAMLPIASAMDGGLGEVGVQSRTPQDSTAPVCLLARYLAQPWPILVSGSKIEGNNIKEKGKDKKEKKKGGEKEI
jgi:hypothetical protein